MVQNNHNKQHFREGCLCLLTFRVAVCQLVFLYILITFLHIAHLTDLRIIVMNSL